MEAPTTAEQVNNSEVWRIVTDHPDIFYTHVVTKLNGNDVKFFYDVNSESRRAIKNSNARFPDAFVIGDFETKSTYRGLSRSVLKRRNDFVGEWLGMET